MPAYQIVSRTAPNAAPPKKQVRRIPRAWLIAIHVTRSMGISAFLFVAILTVTRSDYAFILLPVFLSIFISGSRGYSFTNILTDTPLYLLLTGCLALVYYAVITGFVLLTHPASASIIYATVALAWAVILEPVRAYFQSFIERRFNVRNREARKAVETFTATLREEIDLDQLCERFFALIQQTMRPYSVSLWTLARAGQQEPTSTQELSEMIIASDDPIIAYALKHPGVVEIDRLQLNSPVTRIWEESGVELALLLVSRRELLGVLTLGRRIPSSSSHSYPLARKLLRLLLLGLYDDEQEYTSEERTMLDTLAVQVAPALRVTQLVQEQQVQVRERERIEQELRTAQAIQRAFLPKEIPDLPGWLLMPYYEPAREVGGDFYDFLLFEDGRLGIVIGDVTGKGIPAALVMATVHTMLRSTTQETTAPSEVLARVNDLLCTEIPSGMFVTCFYVLLDPHSGRLRYANAGHEPPFRQHEGNAAELWASGMPLGLLSGTRYEEYEAMLEQGESLLFYSDGLVEAHTTKGEMFGFPRLQALLSGNNGRTSLNDFLLSELKQFTGDEWEQEDDVTLVTLQRMMSPDAKQDGNTQ